MATAVKTNAIDPLLDPRRGRATARRLTLLVGSARIHGDGPPSTKLGRAYIKARMRNSTSTEIRPLLHCAACRTLYHSAIQKYDHCGRTQDEVERITL